MDKSTHKVEVFIINQIETCPNSDNLDLIIHKGFQTVVRKGEFKIGDKAVFIGPDSLVLTSRPEFAFLASLGIQVRIKVKKLRGVVSMGLLIRAPEWAEEEDNLAAYFGVEHYEPELKFTTQDENVGAPSGYYPKYDIDSIRGNMDVFKEGELVICLEKINGCFSRYVWVEQMYVGSRTNWKKQKDTNLWWQAFKNTPSIEIFCKDNPNVVLCGEVVGQVKHFKYGRISPGFLAFDIMKEGKWLNVKEFLEICQQYSIPTVPILGLDISFNWSTIELMAEGPSVVEGATNIREGVVIKSMIERWDERIGRVILKLVSNNYLSK